MNKEIIIEQYRVNLSKLSINTFIIETTILPFIWWHHTCPMNLTILFFSIVVLEKMVQKSLVYSEIAWIETNFTRIGWLPPK